ncbi:MAG TPA: DNA polymerase IV [Acidimicrobiales bacterium]
MTGPVAGQLDAPHLDILHLDMDAFYAAVEILDDPALAGRPVIVGGSGTRGVVASCSYEARAYGVRSAMPSVQASRLCPQAVFRPGRFDVYAAVSHRLHQVLASFTPLVEGIGLDEAFLDVRGARRLFGSGTDIAHAVRERVHDELRLWSSVGVARSKLLAKLASRAAKPAATPAGPRAGAGVVAVEPDAELGFLHPLPVSALWGVGPVTAARLTRLGVSTVGDLAAVPVETLVITVGQALGRQLHELAWARDPRSVEPDRDVKSVGHEETYAHDDHDVTSLRRQVVRMSDAVAARLRGGDKAGRTVTLKVRFGDMSTITRSHSLVDPVDQGPVIAKVAAELLGAVDVRPGVRLLGVSVSGLTGASDQGAQQLSFGDLAEGSRGRETAASGALDAVRARFGSEAMGPASLAGPDGVDVKRKGDTQWGPRSGQPGSS